LIAAGALIVSGNSNRFLQSGAAQTLDVIDAVKLAWSWGRVLRWCRGGKTQER
jgi:hypothetical protein